MGRVLGAGLLVTLLAVTAAGAQERPAGTAVMSGRVLDAATGQPVPGVSILIRELERATVTDETGGFVLEALPEGTFTWVFRRLGYTTWESVSPVADRDWFTVRLMPRPEVLAGITVVADGFERRQRRAASSVQVLDERDAATSGATTVHRLLSSRGNLSIIPCSEHHCVHYRGRTTVPRVYVDDERYEAGLQGLQDYQAAEIHLVEILKDAVGVRIYVTTTAYAERLAMQGREPPRYRAIEGPPVQETGNTIESEELRRQRDPRTPARPPGGP